MLLNVVPFLKNLFKKPFDKKNLNVILILIIIILILLCFKSCKSTAELKAEIKKQELIANNNYDALNGKITTLTTKNGELEYSKTALYADAKTLEKLNTKLAAELKKEKGNVKVIVNTQTEIKYVPVSVPNTIIEYGSGRYGLGFSTSYKDSGLVSEMEGVSNFHIGENNSILPDSTVITKNKMKIDITYGMRERGDKIEIFARSKSPLISFNEIDGAYIPTTGNKILPDDKKPGPPLKPAKWSLGPQTTYMYNITSGLGSYNFHANLLYRLNKNLMLGANGGLDYNIGVTKPDIRFGVTAQYFLFKW